MTARSAAAAALTLTGDFGATPAWSRLVLRGGVPRRGVVDLHVHDADFVLRPLLAGRVPFTVSVTKTHVTTAYQLQPPASRRGRGRGRRPAQCSAWAPPRGVRACHGGLRPDLATRSSSYIATAWASRSTSRRTADMTRKSASSSIANRKTDVAATMDDAVGVTELLDAECASLEQCAVVQL